MRKVFTILISILLVALLIFSVHSCMKNYELSKNPQTDETNLPEKEQTSDIGENNEDEVTEEEPPVKTFTETGIYNGKIDSFSIEVTIGNDNSLIQAYKLSPEIAENLSSYKLKLDSIITFEYQEIDGQNVITKIIQ